jgi:hypothetical protein
MKKVVYSVLISSIISTVPIYADASTALSLEKAQMKYILSYQALQKAKKTPNQLENLAKYVKNYREAYAQYLQLLDDNGLYKPTEKDLNPADDFNDQEFNSTRNWQDWETINPNDYIESVNDLVEKGESPDAVIETVMSKIPEDTYSEEIKTENPCPSSTEPIQLASKDCATSNNQGSDGCTSPRAKDGKHHSNKNDKRWRKTNGQGLLYDNPLEEEEHVCKYCGATFIKRKPKPEPPKPDPRNGPKRMNE